MSNDKTTRYLSLTEDMRRKVKSGAFRPGDRLPSISELRVSYGIGNSTIERAYMLLEQEGLIERQHGRGTFVTQRQQKALPRTSVIGFCSGGFTQTNFSPFWMHLMDGVEKAARKYDAQILLLRDDSSAGWDQVDGVLVSGTWPKVPVHRLAPDLPFVSLFAPATLVGDASECAHVQANMTTLRPDDISGMRKATEHLLSLGHRRIAYLSNKNNDTVIYPFRVAGYLDALRASGVKPNERWLRSLLSPGPALYFMRAGRDAMKAWLEDDWNALGCTALLAHNDDVAWGAVEALREAGLRVPDDVSVIGYDGGEAANCCNPTLTTIEVPLREMGAQSVELLWSRINGESIPDEILIPTKLCTADSTARI